jgi:hypothetical protein
MADAPAGSRAEAHGFWFCKSQANRWPAPKYLFQLTK